MYTAPLTITKLGDAIYNIAVTRSGVALSLDHVKLYFTVKLNPATQDDEQADLQCTSDTGEGIVIENPVTLGKAQLTITAEQTIPLVVGKKYYWDLKMIDDGGEPLYLAAGTLIVNQNVTQAVT